MKIEIVEKYIKTLLIRAKSSKIVAFCLLPLFFLSFLFLGIIYIRKKVLLFKRRRRSLHPKVVTVGNVSFGGTGKTPFLLLLLKNFNHNVAYVSRGYIPKQFKEAFGFGRKKRKPFLGKSSSCTASLCGDEAVQIARRFPDVCISIAEDKWEAVERVEKSFDLIFLDDGLQRYDVPRDIEIATVDVTCPDGYGGLFPRGFLREPLSRLKEVDYIVLTNIYPNNLKNREFSEAECPRFDSEKSSPLLDIGADFSKSKMGHSVKEKIDSSGCLGMSKDPEKLCEEYSARFSRPVIACQLQITRFFDAQGKTSIPQQKIALFSAIASPERVRNLMERNGFLVVDHLVFSDHVDIDLKAVYTFCEMVRIQGATAIIGTEKDFVKKECWPEFCLPLFFSEVDFEVVAGKDAFEKLLVKIGELRGSY